MAETTGLDEQRIAPADLRASSAVQSKPIHVEIHPRDTYQHHVAAEVNDLISWSFFTRRKNIAFGLFYLHTHASSSRRDGNTLSVPLPKQKLPLPTEVEETAMKEAVMATRGSVYIHPTASPKPGHGSTSLQSSRTGSVQLGSTDDLTASLLPRASTSSVEGLSRSKTLDSRSNVETISMSGSASAVLGMHKNVSQTDLRATIAGIAPSISAPNAIEYIEILPVERYESFEATISGHYEVPVKGTYILYFDNSYSINTSKELFLTVSVGPIIPPTNEVLSGWLLKKKQRRLQGWARRWFQLDRKGILSYFEDRFSPCRGSVDLNHCAITKIPQKLMMTIDSGSVTHHLRAYSVEDYSRWSEQFTFLRSQAALLMLDAADGGAATSTGGMGIDMAATGSGAGPVTPVGSILKHSERIHQQMRKGEGLLADLRALATREDSGMVKYLVPLEHTFQSLQDLYDALADYAIFLQRTGRRMSQISTNRALFMDPTQQQQLLASLRSTSTAVGIPVPGQTTGSVKSPVVDPSVLSIDEFYDAQEVILTEVSEVSGDDYDFGPASIAESSAAGMESMFEMGLGMTVEFSDALELVEASPPDKEKPIMGSHAFRLRMPHIAPSCNVSLSNILRRSIGKDWSTISMPVALNEPLSALQRLCEELEYSELLDEAASLGTAPLERMVRVVAFAVSAYASSVHRAERKPFNPLLGETFEYVRSDRGYRFIAEKVSHRPLVIACHAESAHWSWWQDQRMKSKFWGKSMEYIPLGAVHVQFPDTGDHFIWSKVITCVRNLLSGNKWVENYGEMVMRNERTGDIAKIIFKSNSSGFFGSSNNTGANEVVAAITSPSGESITLRGRWDSLLMRERSDGQIPQLVWRAAAVPNDHLEYYGFGQFAITLNDIPKWLRDQLPLTDSRLRPDQRQLEEGRLEEAEATKQMLEQRQRDWRMRLEETSEAWQPRWFCHTSVKEDPEGAWVIQRLALREPKNTEMSEGNLGDYWECRKDGNWPSSPFLWTT